MEYSRAAAMWRVFTGPPEDTSIDAVSVTMQRALRVCCLPFQLPDQRILSACSVVSAVSIECAAACPGRGGIRRRPQAHVTDELPASDDDVVDCSSVCRFNLSFT